MRARSLGDTDLAACHAILRRGSKTFSVASWLLPQPVRDRATVLYAYCRMVDDRIDDDPRASRSTLDGLRSRLDRAYEGRPHDEPVDRALARLLAGTHIPRALPLALLEGMEWDLSGRRYETLEDLQAYGARVAGTVGAMMTFLMGTRGESALARACDLGVAMQLTNVARDVGEDARRGRLYLPEAWLRAEGLDPDAWINDPRPCPGLAKVIARLISSADELYLQADHGIALLPRNCRLAIRAARRVYADIGRVVAASDYDSVTRRAYVSSPRKLWLIMSAWGSRWASCPPMTVPAIRATQELVAACTTGS